MSASDGISSELVGTASGEIDRDVFVNEKIYAQERERVFRHSWLFVGHESQIPKIGDFVLSRMGEESVILTRDKDNKIQVLLNSCRHRGMRVCRYDQGHTSKFFCPYHGWTYNLDGSLANVTAHKTEYQVRPFDWHEWGLVKVGQIATLGGSVWATWESAGPDFDAFLGEGRKMLDLSFRAWDGEGEIEFLGAPQKWIIPSNWKIVSENFAGDRLHVVSHRSVDMVGIGPNDQPGRRDVPPSRIVQANYSGGHACVYLMYERTDPRHTYAGSSATAEYFQRCLAKRRKLLGAEADIVAAVGTIYPNMSFHGFQPQTVLVAHPVSVTKTEMWRYYFVDRDAPQEVKDYLRKYYIRYSGPAGMTEQDDMENWAYATEAGSGATASRYPYNYMAGLDTDVDVAELPGASCSPTGFSEGNARRLYARWLEQMQA